jgi:hypothetical protein
VSYVIAVISSDSFTYTQYDYPSQTFSGDYQLIGIKSLFKSSEAYYGVDLVSLSSLSCTGSACPATCLKKSKCLELRGNILNNVCVLCAPNQYY